MRFIVDRAPGQCFWLEQDSAGKWLLMEADSFLGPNVKALEPQDPLGHTGLRGADVVREWLRGAKRMSQRKLDAARRYLAGGQQRVPA
jgi:hypothetical protein